MKKTLSFKLATTVLCIFIFSMNVKAQIDSHYWTYQYGAKGLLLNGAVIASADDETAIFYNPGCMGQGNLGFAFSYFTPTYNTAKVENFLGDGFNLENNGADLSPGFFALRFKPFKSDRITAGVATFQRYSSDVNFDSRVVDDLSENVVLLYAGDLEFSRKLSEDWFGFGLNYNVNNKFGIGVTQFSVWHDEDFRLHFNKEIYSPNNPEQVAIGWRSNFNYNFNAYAGFLTKLGLSWHTTAFSFGATVTTPTYGYLYTSAAYDYDDQKIFEIDSLTTISNRRDLDEANYKTPFSFGLGLEFRMGNITCSLSGEHFAAIGEYTIFEDFDDPFDGLSGTDNAPLTQIRTSNNSVTNFAIGIQNKVSEKRTWLMGFRTDFSEQARLIVNNNEDVLGSSPDVFHISGGGMFNFGKNQISIGVDYGFGTSSGGRQLTDLTNITASNIFEFSGKNNVNTTINTIMLFVTYDFLFAGIKTIDDEN